jgi:hypothetical protein
MSYEIQCSLCCTFVREKAASFVSSCGHIFCSSCFQHGSVGGGSAPPDQCACCGEACDFLRLSETDAYPDLHNCLFGSLEELVEKTKDMHNVSRALAS